MHADFVKFSKPQKKVLACLILDHQYITLLWFIYLKYQKNELSFSIFLEDLKIILARQYSSAIKKNMLACSVYLGHSKLH